MTKAQQDISAQAYPLTVDNGVQFWPQNADSNWLGNTGVNICWQDTTSNATYCSAANALSMT